ncbi:MAG TPA: NAD(P)-dependent alcohol dehydrogenase [Thermoanaerobaculia bacterium]|nr:NAD(P)-dependent alcohol dehydrogenase [Thermoanaerobaculia bacterium]
MKAIVYHRYGDADVLDYQEVDKPGPTADEVLIRVHAAAINPYDKHFIGSKVTSFKAGDEVFGAARGAFAEYACARESAIALKPATLTFEEVAALPVAAQTALQGLRDKGKVQAGQRVLINGAAGGVGTFAVQLAKSFGARVTGVCSTHNVDLVHSLGAEDVIDYTKDDFTERRSHYDVLYDCIGNHSVAACRRALKPKGIYIMVGGPISAWLSPFDRLFQVLALSPFVSQKLAPFLAQGRREDLLTLARLLEAGTVKSVIDRTYDLSETQEAMRYFAEGHARGKVMIRVR